MGIEAAKVDLARWGDARGVISWRISGTLREGNLLLSELHDAYEATAKGPVAGYDLPSIQAVLEPFGGWHPGFSAFDSFIGLLVFDALIGNTDRHHENWAVIEEDRRLSPSYDHGASLGFNASQRARSTPRNFAQKGRSRHFPGRPNLADLAVTAGAMVDRDVLTHWLDGVNSVTSDAVETVVGSLPHGSMSGVMRTFVPELVAENRRRLLQ